MIHVGPQHIISYDMYAYFSNLSRDLLHCIIMAVIT